MSRCGARQWSAWGRSAVAHRSIECVRRVKKGHRALAEPPSRPSPRPSRRRSSTAPLTRRRASGPTAWPRSACGAPPRRAGPGAPTASGSLQRGAPARAAPARRGQSARGPAQAHPPSATRHSPNRGAAQPRETPQRTPDPQERPLGSASERCPFNQSHGLRPGGAGAPYRPQCQLENKLALAKRRPRLAHVGGVLHRPSDANNAGARGVDSARQTHAPRIPWAARGVDVMHRRVSSELTA